MTDNLEGDHQVDARGLRCPEPVMMLHACIRRMTPGQTVRVLADDPASTRDIAKFCEHLGHTLVVQTAGEGAFVFVVRKRA